MVPTKVLASLGLGRSEPLLQITRPSFEAYARKQGYELVIPTRDPAPERRHKHWAKIALVNSLLPTCDLLVWVDADAAIIDSSTEIADHLPDSKSLGLVEHRYSGQSVPNTGVMLVRSNRWSRRFFRKVWGMTQYLETKWHDNAAVLELLGYEFDWDANPLKCRRVRTSKWSRGVAFLGHEWNSIPEDPAPSPHIVHITGSHPMEERVSLLRAALTNESVVPPQASA